MDNEKNKKEWEHAEVEIIAISEDVIVTSDIEMPIEDL